VAGGLVVASGITAKPAQARVAIDVDLHFGSGHSVWFERQPRFVVVPNTRVYYASYDDCDVYRYGDMYYMNNGADWYCSRSYDEPFVRVSYERVPRQIWRVPSHYRRYSYQPSRRDPWASHWRDNNDRGRDYSRNDGRWYRDRNVRDDDPRWKNDRSDRRGPGNGNGRGHGKGKAKGKGHGRGHDNDRDDRDWRDRG
jgi:hypothetical protein